MNHKEFVSTLAQRTSLPAKHTQTLVNHLLAELTARFEEGDALQVQSFGSFEVKKKLERVVVSPNGGHRMLVPPKLTLVFKPSPSMKENIQEGGES